MSTRPLESSRMMAPAVTRTIQSRSLIIGIAFSVGAIIGGFSRPDEFFRGYLLAFMAWLGVTLGSMAILMIRHLTGGGWGTVIRRVMGAAMRCVPLMTVLFIPILFGLPRLYIWDRPLSTIADAKLRAHLQDITQSYLSVHGFIWRAVVYFAIWNVLSFLLTRWSREQDQLNPTLNAQKFKAVSGPGLVLYAFTISFAAIDWLMSIDPSWISTIYGLIVLIGEVLSAMCFAVVVERILVNYKPMSEWLRPDFVQDHGKWILTFLMLWAYFSFSQLLIIWAGNLPDEITWYFRRFSGGWPAVGFALIFFHFVVPFVLLLSRSFKRDVRKLVWLAMWLMIMRLVDLFWIIEPNFSARLTVTWADVVLPIAMGGIWLWLYFRNLNSMPLLSVNDPDAFEVLEPVHE
ncbi:MAG TPA: hypothetical protein VEI49_07115 [Terriglobales bacterium]|nr:hypothetical protein [Terriglobales bacterium]HXY14459.1 hypothetical protein [Terriglobales bacterium]